MPAIDRASRGSELQPYEIRVQGHLDFRWACPRSCLTLTRQHDGTTTLRAPSIDQATLHGLLSRIRDLGLLIVSMRRLCPDSPAREAREEGPA